MIETYIIIALIVAIFFLVSVHVDKGFDKWVHDTTGGQIEYSSLDKILIPLLVGLIWPYTFYLIGKVILNGR